MIKCPKRFAIIFCALFGPYMTFTIEMQRQRYKETNVDFMSIFYLRNIPFLYHALFLIQENQKFESNASVSVLVIYSNELNSNRTQQN